ncbi:NAD(P)-dependent oxidoreductase [Geminicoccaceae bacterium 1502E]|nr:NAD(P)-dependent oxidoreductase [Geminicoccaceae bacterium 1502E]
MTRTIAITGAAGSIGRKLRAHFEGRGDCSLRLLDSDAGGDPAVIEADLARWDESWVETFAQADAVIHLAGDPRPDAPWGSVVRSNVDLVLNVFEAAVRQKAGRLIFASSNWTMAGHRFAGGELGTGREPAPVNAYGVSKLMGERIGRSFSERHGLSVVCFRIGYCQQEPGNRPGPHMGWNRWGQEMWLSDRDLCSAFELAVDAPQELRFEVLNLMSQNQGMRWDIESTKRVLGWQPQDGWAPELTDAMRADEEAARKARAVIEHTEALLADRRW